MDLGNHFERFPDFSVISETETLNFLKTYTIKSEIKSSTKRTRCNIGSCRSDGSSFFATKLLSILEN